MLSISQHHLTLGKPASRPSKRAWQWATVLALTALVSSLLLTGVSAWFLGAVALAGAGPAALVFNFHVPAALVRLFAMARTAAKYGERVVGHKAALLDQVSRRASLFAAMAVAPRVRARGWQLGDQDRLSDFMDDVEDVDYARLRVGLPVLSIATGLCVLAAATVALVPLAVLPIVPLALIIAVLARQLLPRAAIARRSIRSLRRGAARRLGSALSALVPLQAEREWASLLDAAFERLELAETATLRSRQEQTWLDCAVGVFGPVSAVSVMVLAWTGGTRGEDLLYAAFLAFAWLAMGELLHGSSRILVARVREDIAKLSIGHWTTDERSTLKRATIDRLEELHLIGVPLRAPDGRLIGHPVDLVLQKGRPTAIRGPSGCGKTSLLKEVAGWLDARGGEVLSDRVALNLVERRQMAHLCLHDSAILSDTIRENLFAPSATDPECLAALNAVELGGRVQSAGGLNGWITQGMLSLGEAQRLNLARAMLSPLPVILLDEPTEHLDAEQSRRILSRLIVHFRDRILLFASHDCSSPWLYRQVKTITLSSSASVKSVLTEIKEARPNLRSSESQRLP